LEKKQELEVKLAFLSLKAKTEVVDKSKLVLKKFPMRDREKERGNDRARAHNNT
jgi:hypothetical protein